MDRSERLIKPGDSWFSAKIILVIRSLLVFGVSVIFEHCNLDYLAKFLEAKNTKT